MLQLYPVYLLWNRHKTLTGSPGPVRANGTNRPCQQKQLIDFYSKNAKQKDKISMNEEVLFPGN